MKNSSIKRSIVGLVFLAILGSSLSLMSQLHPSSVNVSGNDSGERGGGYTSSGGHTGNVFSDNGGTGVNGFTDSSDKGHGYGDKGNGFNDSGDKGHGYSSIGHKGGNGFNGTGEKGKGVPEDSKGRDGYASLDNESHGLYGNSALFINDDSGNGGGNGFSNYGEKGNGFSSSSVGAGNGFDKLENSNKGAGNG